MSGREWTEAAELFSQVLDAEPGEREELLKGSGASLAVVEEVRRLLRNVEEAGEDFLEETPEEVRRMRAERRHQVGEVLAGRFEVEEFLGSGGMGEVYGCRDVRSGAEVAIKTLRLDAVGNWGEKQLRRELAMARRLVHPNVCRVEELHFDKAAGMLYLEMEWVRGESLTKRLERGPLEAEEALRAAEQVGSVMDAAHGLGILHRDLKSANILLSNDPGRGAVVMDFGLARDQETGREDSTVIGTGVVAGTPAYMSPEQLRGEKATVASEVYSFGVVLYEMLSGVKPFEGQTAFQIAERRLRKRPPRLKIPRRWERVIQDCLEKEPGSRPRSCGEAARRLRQGSLVLFSSRTERRQVLLGLGSASVVLGGGWFGYEEWLLRRLTPMSPAAEAAWKRGLEIAKQRTEEGSRAALEELTKASELAPDAPEVWNSLAETHLTAVNFMFNDPVESRRAAERAAAESLRLRPRQARTLGVLGVLRAYDFGRWKDAETYFEQALKIDERDAQVHNWYANFLGRARRGEESLGHIRRALELDPASQSYNHQLAVQLFRMKRYAEQEAHCREMVRLHPTEAANHLALARALLFTGKLGEARQHTAEASKLRYSVLARSLEAELAVKEGDLAKAKREAAELETYWRTNRMETLLLLYIYAQLGEGKKVVELAREGIKRGDATVLAVPSSPYFERFEGEPDYQGLLRELGF